MPIRQLSEGPCKTYLLADRGRAVLIDPLLERVDDCLALLKSEGLKLTAVLDTHTHADHLSGCAALRDRTDADYVMHTSAPEACVTRRLEDGEALACGGLSLKALHTPGHTPDSLTLVLPDRVLSGDFLFIGSLGAGRLDLPGSDPAVHFASLAKLSKLPGAMALSPAHDYQGYSESTLGAERARNPLFQPRTQEQYLKWWSERNFAPAPWMLEVVKANAACTRDPHAVRIPKDEAACACASPGKPAACATGGSEREFPAISVLELARQLHEKRPYFLLDVRTPEEFSGELGHIKGSVLIPVDELPDRVKEVPAGAAVISICRSGKRASRAAETLKGAGVEKVWVLEGGMLAWNQAKLPVA